MKYVIVTLFITYISRFERLECHEHPISSSSLFDVPDYNKKDVDNKFFLKQIFLKYGEKDVMTLDKFKELLERIGLTHLFKTDHDNHDHDHHDHHAKHDSFSSTTSLTNKIALKREMEEMISHETHDISNETKKNNHTELNLYNNDTADFHQSLLSGNVSDVQCFQVTDILHSFDVKDFITPDQFQNLCPAIIYELDNENCSGFQGDESDVEKEEYSSLVWAYASVAVAIISLSGLLVVAGIPIMKGRFYHLALQFLVALAVGSLVGDALLHLLPHAMAEEHQHHRHHHHHHNPHDEHEHAITHKDEQMMLKKGLVAVISILVFFIAERLLTVISIRRKQQQIMAEDEDKIKDLELSKSVGEKLSKHKYNSYGYCYGEVTLDVLQGLNETVCDDKDHHNCLERESSSTNNLNDMSKIKIIRSAEDLKVLANNHSKQGDGDHLDFPHNSGVIVTDHEHQHHGHSHTHTHTVPSSISSVAWMVIMGDGLHNFSDGLAIGAAFANSITGGISTAIAVFCHELPHELGDFAVLLKSGMTAKQAIAYNGLSSVLCFFGMLLGVALGNVASVTSWIFAGAAGMFVYIALVDMIPELNSIPTIKSVAGDDKMRLGIQILGMSLGVTIMLLIALYEHDLQMAVHD